MKRVLTALLLIPIVLILVFLGPKWQWLFTAATALVACLAAWEYLSLASHGQADPPRIPVLVAIVALFAGNYQYPDQLFPILGLLSLGLIVYCTFSSPVSRAMANTASSVFCLIYIGLTLISLPILREETNGPSVLVFLLCTVWAGDIAALYIGRPWGRHKLAPTISPNKSWEGSIASVLGSVAVAGLLLGLSELMSQWDFVRLSYSEGAWWYWLGLAVIVNLAAQVGDLAESAIKRSVNVKDSGTLLPGHGGVLDRIDALLLAAPVLWYAQLIYQRF